MGRRSLALLGLVLALVAAAPAAADDPVQQKASVDARIAALQAQISASKAQEGVLTSQLSAVADELQSAEDAVSSAEASVSSLEADLSLAQAQLDRLVALLDVQTQRLERLRNEYEKAIAILEARVRAAYIDEPPDMLAFLVSASSFDEVIDNVELLTRIGRQDQRIAHQVATAKARRPNRWRHRAPRSPRRSAARSSRRAPGGAASLRLQGSSGRATGSSRVASGCGGGACTRASTSDAPTGRRIERPRPGP
jgi:septal ring factor EnvC (AmiA/AmiB activator)